MPPAGAQAAGGPLTYQGCIANHGRHGCEAPDHNSLGAPQSVVVSPDGSNVYVASFFANSLTTFDRDGSGTLTEAGCFSEFHQFGCTRIKHPYLMDQIWKIAISPDGKNLYAITDVAILSFDRAADGSLTFQSCVGYEGYGCKEPSVPSSDSAQDIAVSPDGNDVYTVSFNADSVSWFSRSPEGTLTFQGCFSDEVDGCRRIKKSPLLGAYTVAVSPAGDSVYAGTGIAMLSFRRRADGSIAYKGCLSRKTFSGCVRTPNPLGMLWDGIATAGQWVYAAGDGRISVFQPHSDGSMSYQSCVDDHRTGPCSHVPEGTLLGLAGLAGSPDSESLYAGGLTTVANLVPRDDGSLALASCVANKGRDRPRQCPSTGNDVFDSVWGMAASPDGDSVYAGSREGAAVATLGR